MTSKIDTHNAFSTERERRMLSISSLFTALLFLVIAGCSPQTSATQPITRSPAEPGAPELAGTVLAPDTEKMAKIEADILIAAVAGLSSHGLDPEDYGLSRLKALEIDPEAQGRAMRDAWLLAATHLAHGRLDPKTLIPRRSATPVESGLLARLDAEGGPTVLAAALDEFAPRHPEYSALRSELALERLATTVETDPGKLAEHDAAIEKLRVNLERWRWLPRDLGPRYVFANIAGLDVTGFEGDLIAAQFVAIFGKLDRRTPTFSDEIEYVIFNPWWEVPDSIARNDKLPQFRRDPSAVARLGYRVFDKAGNTVNPADIDWNSVSARAFPYRLRQAPGPSNALGQVKIMFPNAYNVYLHDTPDRALFDAEQRLFSSGCIRVKEPLNLVEWLLQDTKDWDRVKIDAVVASGIETRVTLTAPIPVHVVYFTVVADETCQRARYLTDVYGRDAAVAQALKAKLTP